VRRDVKQVTSQKVYPFERGY